MGPMPILGTIKGVCIGPMPIETFLGVTPLSSLYGSNTHTWNNLYLNLLKSKGLSYNLNGSNSYILMVIMIGDDKSVFYKTFVGSLNGSNNYRLIILYSDL
jgi:hypothetical protein